MAQLQTSFTAKIDKAAVDAAVAAITPNGALETKCVCCGFNKDGEIEINVLITQEVNPS